MQNEDEKPIQNLEDLQDQIATQYLNFISSLHKTLSRSSQDIIIQAVEEYKKDISKYDKIFGYSRVILSNIYAFIGREASLKHARELGCEAYCVYHQCDMKNCPPDAHE